MVSNATVLVSSAGMHVHSAEHFIQICELIAMAAPLAASDILPGGLVGFSTLRVMMRSILTNSLPSCCIAAGSASQCCPGEGKVARGQKPDLLARHAVMT